MTTRIRVVVSAAGDLTRTQTGTLSGSDYAGRVEIVETYQEIRADTAEGANRIIGYSLTERRATLDGVLVPVPAEAQALAEKVGAEVGRVWLGADYLPTPPSRTDVRPDEIKAREHEKCAHCGRRGAHSHHRKPKSRGGPDTFDNQIYVCAEYHAWIHDVAPAAATDAGYLIGSFVPDDEIAAVPLFYFDRDALVRLGRDGSVNALEATT
jgi:hypothetical protein